MASALFSQEPLNGVYNGMTPWANSHAAREVAAAQKPRGNMMGGLAHLNDTWLAAIADWE